jgi:hypothetical protein
MISDLSDVRRVPHCFDDTEIVFYDIRLQYNMLSLPFHRRLLIKRVMQIRQIRIERKQN